MDLYFKKSKEYIKNIWDEYFIEGHNKHIRYITYISLVLFAVFIIGYNALYIAPNNFPVGGLVSIKKGMTLTDVGELLSKKSVIKSKHFFSSLVIILAGEKGVLSGDYYFPTPESVLGVVVRVTRGQYGLDPVRITIPEGATITEIGEVLDWKLPSFPIREFLDLSKNKEGYLFPDTYFFLPNAEPKLIIRTMKENFYLKIKSLSDKISKSEHSLDDIIKMASILEKEAYSLKDKKIISGILWKRIKIGMPLQVDAPFIYGVGKNTFNLTTKDLRTNSPYNTYTNKGLTPTPISNPGINSIIAALEPEKTPFFFYLSDRKGKIHYGITFEDHKKNKRDYIY